MFATHYFELTQLPEKLAHCVNVHLDAVEQDEHIVFLHSVKPGPASKSYGLQVAALAGVPREVIQQAHKKLAQLEDPANSRSHNKSPDKDEQKSHLLTERLIEKIQALDPDELSPRDALDMIYQLQNLLNKT